MKHVYMVFMGIANTNYTGPLVPVQNYLDALRSCKGIWYKWGGKDPHGLDCSGTVTYALWLAAGTLRLEDFPDLRAMWNAERLYKASGSPVEPINYTPGMLAFYGPKGSPNHVMSLVAGSNGVLTAYGACGAGSQCTTVEYAKAHKACVQERPRVAYRPDLLGVFRLPFIDYR